MKKLTNSQINTIKKQFEPKTVEITIAEDKVIKFKIKQYLSPIELDYIINDIDAMIFAGGVYNPQYRDVACRVAWLNTCTDIPTVLKQVKNGETDIETVDYETEDLIVRLVFSQYHSNVFDEICVYADKYIEDKLNTIQNTLRQTTLKLQEDVNSVLDFVGDISETINGLKTNPELIKELQSTSQNLMEFNKNINSANSEKIIKLADTNKE